MMVRPKSARLKLLSMAKSSPTVIKIKKKTGQKRPDRFLFNF
jgi:hypothetical protein